jgi:hypothetical protein
MTDLMKGLLLGTFFLTVFLIIYLLINLRSDPLEVLRQRVKHFQVQLITELVEGPGRTDWGRWRRELESRQSEITWQIQRGVGKVSRRQKPVIEEYMSKSWNEILDLISSRAETPQGPPVGALDISRLEALIKNALQNAAFARSLPAREPHVEAVTASQGSGQAEAIEEAEAMEVSAVSEAPDAPGEAEAIEEAEAVEEVEEGQAVEATAVSEAPDASGEAEAIEEAEAVEEVEEGQAVEATAVSKALDASGEAEAIEEAEAVEEVEEGQAVEATAVSKALDASGEAEAIEEAEAVEDLEETGGTEVPTVSEGTAVALGEAEAIEEAEAVEELEEAGAPTALEEVADAPWEVKSVGTFEAVEEDATVPPTDGSAEVEAIEELEEAPVSDESAALEPVDLESLEKHPESAAAHLPVFETASTLPAREPAILGAFETAGPFGDAEYSFTKTPESIDSPNEILEELEALPDIRPLPPEPREEGLEFLPAAEEEDSTEQPFGRETHIIDGVSRESGAPYRQDLRRLEELSDVEELSDAEEILGMETSMTSLIGVEPENPQDEQELSQLETIDEESGVEDAVRGRGLSLEDKRGELMKLLSNGAIKSWTIGELQRLVDEGKSAIVMEDGVFRIKDEVYGAGTPEDHNATLPRDGSRNGELREIAQEVVSHASPPAQSSESSFSGIGDLISDTAVFEVPGGLLRERDRTPEETLPSDKERICPIKLTRNGIDYDDFLSFYPRSIIQTQQMKSLAEVSRRVSAVSAGVLVKRPYGYFLELSIGLNEKSSQQLHFDSEDPFNVLFFAERKAVAIDRNPSDIQTWRILIDLEDLRYMKRILLIPATFHSREAYLLLGFAADQDIVLRNIFSNLLIR